MPESLPNSCGYDPEQNLALQAKVRDGALVAVFHKATGRILYVSPEVRAVLPADDYLSLLRPADR